MCEFIKSIIGPAIGGLIAFIGGWFLFWLRWRQDGRDQFRAVTADMLAKSDAMKDRLDQFFEQSISILRPAIYRVRPFAKDWDGLEKLWRKYESHKKQDFTVTAALLESVLSAALKETTNPIKTPHQLVKEYLYGFDKHVA